MLMGETHKKMLLLMNTVFPPILNTFVKQGRNHVVNIERGEAIIYIYIVYTVYTHDFYCNKLGSILNRYIIFLSNDVFLK